MLAGNYTETTRDAWCTVPGRSIEFTNNANGDPVTLRYYENQNLVFVKNLTYDENGKIIKIECTEGN